MTDDEHITRAMLLGMRYIEPYGFYTTSKPGDSAYDPRIKRLDATTLQPISLDEVLKRHARNVSHPQVA